MNALFALALLISPARAGVIAPVESVVSPAGPSATAVPVLAPAGGSLIAPSYGEADLRGALPLLPAPVPGLGGPALSFVGNVPDAAAAHPEAAAVRTSPAPATAAQGRVADKTPALPAKVSPGSPSLAISSDRKAAGSTPENGLKPTRAQGDEGSPNPLLESSSIEAARPEQAAGLGRSFFDRSNDKNRGELSNTAAADPSAPVIAATMLEGGAFGRGHVPGAAGRLSQRDAGAAFGAGHETSRGVALDATRSETLHDAVASALPPGAAQSGGAVKFFGASAPNGELPASAGVAALPALGAPRPLSLDLSSSGLIVRVRSALSGVMGTAEPSAVSSIRPVVPGPSTALIERGAMLEAFAVAGDYAVQTTARMQSMSAGVSRAAAPFAPTAPARSSTAPLWWAWFALPLFVAAIRGIL